MQGIFPGYLAGDRRYQLESSQTILMPNLAQPAADLRMPAKPRPRGRFLLWAILALAVLAAAWVGLWYFAARQVEGQIDETMARVAKAGGDLSCAERKLAGFPFKILVQCDQLKLELNSADGKTVVTVPNISFLGEVSDPLHPVLTAQSPVSIEAPGRPSAEVSWKSLQASVTLAIGSIMPRDLVIEAPVLRLREGQNMIASSADRLEAHARPDPLRPAADDAYEVTAQLTKAASPFLNFATGEEAPADAQLALSISQVSVLQPHEQEAPQSPLERWRLAGGTVRLARLAATKATLRAELSGEVKLDEQHRLAGRFQPALDGAQALLARLGLPPAAAGLVGKLPVAVANGKVVAGPFAFRLPVIDRPLY